MFCRLVFGSLMLLGGGAVLAQDIWDPPGLTVAPDPAAAGREPQLLRRLVEDGRQIFQARFNVLDGAGRPAATGDAKPTRRLVLPRGVFDRNGGPDALSCTSCHSQSGTGGGGDLSASAFVASATGYVAATPDHGTQVSLRRPPSLFGAGAIELVSREMTAELLARRDAALGDARTSGRNQRISLVTKGVDFGSLEARPDGSYDASGVSGVDQDLIVRPFGWRGEAASLREFAISALNQHHGLQAVERFGWARTGRLDFDEDGVEVEVTPGQVSALVLFVASLPPLPSRPARGGSELSAERGRAAFAAAGCADCHRPSLPLLQDVFVEPGPYNPPGTLAAGEVPWELRLRLSRERQAHGRPVVGREGVGAYTDLKRHRICDAEDTFLCDEQSLRDGRPLGEFLTAKLWALGSGPPYSHRGDCSTLSEVIRHHSGEAAPSRNAFLALAEATKRDVIAFLLSLGPAPSPASPVARAEGAR